MERNDDQVEPSVREMADLDASALSEPTALPDEQPLEPVDPAPERYIAVEPEPKPDLSLPYPAETWQPPDREWVEPYVPAQASMPVLSGFEPPLIDPDDDLPAWGGPPVERLPEPVPYAPPAPPSSGDTFQSSLLADLKPETAQGEELAGPFKSRLLNELTSARNEAEPGGNDVLIAETPAVDPDRGARSE